MLTFPEGKVPSAAFGNRLMARPSHPSGRNSPAAGGPTERRPPSAAGRSPADAAAHRGRARRESSKPLPLGEEALAPTRRICTGGGSGPDPTVPFGGSGAGRPSARPDQPCVAERDIQARFPVQDHGCAASTCTGFASYHSVPASSYSFLHFLPICFLFSTILGQCSPRVELTL
jgi:hypothetical protein